MYRSLRGLRRYPQSGIETKFLDTTLTNVVVAQPPATAAWTGLEVNPVGSLCFNAPVQGTGASNREGRKITMESLQINGLITVVAQADQAAADTNGTIKVWLVLDKQTNGGTATGLDSENVYTNPGATAISGLGPLRNMLYTKRYKVLKEIEVILPQATLTYDGVNMEQAGIQKSWDCYINLKGLKVEYLSNNGTAGDIVDNGLFIMAACSNSSLVPNITYNARLRFRG